MALPLEHFRKEIVAPNVEDFEANQGAMHRGFNAVSAVDAYAAHIYREMMGLGRDPFGECGERPPRQDHNDTHFRGLLAAKSEQFRIIRDVAKANKHAFLTDERSAPIANGSGDTVSVEVGYGRGAYGAGSYGARAQLVVNLRDGSKRELLPVLEAALSYLDGVAARFGFSV